MSYSLRIAVACVAWLALTPAVTLAQSSITGVVRDASGGVLPGVTVEAASNALIEGTRNAVTDDQGLYRLVDLRPGTYDLTFSLTGFNSFKREGLLRNRWRANDEISDSAISGLLKDEFVR